VISYVRKGKDSKVIVICNMTPVPRENYRVGLPDTGKYKLLFNSDDSKYGGSDFKIKKSFNSQKENWQYRDQSVELDLAPLGVLVYGV
jgi:1,4-alpha-glucan branching enzyme